MTSRASLVVVLAAFVLVASCTLFDSVDGYAGPSGVAGPGGTSSDGAVNDAPVDAIVIDSGKSCSAPGDCEDDNPCTTDACWASTCLHTVVVGSACGDDNPCNGTESCDETGACRSGAAPEVDDDNTCTTDFCDPVQGVQHMPGDYPPSKTCNPYTCPSGYYRAKSLLCDPFCGTDNCGYCINGFQCERACLKTVSACCVGAEGCATSCPAGYSPQGTSCTFECGCGSAACGPTVSCQR